MFFRKSFPGNICTMPSQTNNLKCRPRHLMVLLTSLFAISISSCGGGGSGGGSPSSPVANENSVLLGDWAGVGCEISSDFSQFTSYTFNADGTYVITVNSFANTNCSNPTFTVTGFGNFFEGDSSISAEGLPVNDIDFVSIDRRETTPDTVLGAIILNSERICGIDDWQVGVTRSIVGCEIGEIEVVTVPTVFQIFNLEQDYFFTFGNELSFTAQSRPFMLQAGPTLVREISAENDFPPQISGFWQVGTTEVFFEFRSNSVIFLYGPDLNGRLCHVITPIPVRRLSDETYMDHIGDILTLTTTPAGLIFNETANNVDVLLSRELNVQAQDLIPCASIPGG